MSMQLCYLRTYSLISCVAVSTAAEQSLGLPPPPPDMLADIDEPPLPPPPTNPPPVDLESVADIPPRPVKRPPRRQKKKAAAPDPVYAQVTSFSFQSSQSTIYKTNMFFYLLT